LSPDEAIQEYLSVLRSVGADLYSYHFKFEGKRVCIGRGRENDLIQWGMTWYTPDELVALAARRKLNLQRGDPKKPDRMIVDKRN
jgi:hypothetical protein